jgi:hypothetical protein
MGPDVVNFRITLEVNHNMFTDPQSVTVNAVAQSMPRVSTSGQKTTYQKNDQLWTLTISHTPNKDRVRSMVRIDQKAIVADPLTSANDYDTLSFYVVLDRPVFGFTMVQCEQLITGFKTWLDNTAVDKIFGGES